ncbi:MAG: DUF6443 domain-containing protein [Reichenbachiella sp.]|uniref:DUF6443 domain-containing protein n=1 Tax=Reichenbachiella sp. TaxID=2184521 RepID=UPI003266EAD8
MKELAKEIKHTVAIKNIIWTLGLLLLTNAALYAQTATTTDSTAVAEPQIMMISPLEAPMAAAAAADDGGGGSAPADPNTTFSQSYNCGNTVITRNSSPTGGVVWYWQTSSSGTDLTYFGSTYTVTSTGTYYLRSHIPSSGVWGLSYQAIPVNTLHAIPDAPNARQENSKTTSSFNARWYSVSGATSYKLDVATNSSFSNKVSGYNNKTVSGTSQTVSGLSPGDRYYYRLRTKDGNGCTSANSNSITANTTLSTPTASNESSKTTSSFKANWGSVSGADEYLLYVSSNNSFSSHVSGYNGKTVSGTNSTVSGLNPGKNYYYRVKAKTNYHTTGYSNTITANTKLEVPTAQQETCATHEAFTAQWGSVTNATSYKLYVSDQNDFSSHLSGYNGLEISGTSQVVTGLSGGMYYYRVKAKNSVNTSSVSNSIPARVLHEHYDVTGGVVCNENGQTLTMGLQDTQVDFTYKVYKNGSPYQQTIWVDGEPHGTVEIFKAGTGSAITFNTPIDELGTYEVYAISGSCATKMDKDASLVAPPTAYNVTAATYCANSSGALQISDTQLDYEYQVKKDDVNIGSVVIGTGSAMTLGNFDDPGTYTVEATFPGASCSTEMTNEIEISPVVPAPTIPTVSDEECEKRTVTKSGTEPHTSEYGFPITWYWFGNDPDNSNPIILSSHEVTLPDTYYVRAKGFIAAGQECWSEAVSIDINDLIPGPNATVPSIDDIDVTVNSCGPQTASTTQSLEIGEQFFWQGTDPDSRLETDNGSTSDLIYQVDTYYLRTKTSQGCWSDAVAFPVLQVDLYPTSQTLSPVEEYADAPENYRRVHLDQSESDVTYKIYKDGQDTGMLFPGTGGSAVSEILIEDGDYTAVADRNGCTTPVAGTASIGSDANYNYTKSRSFFVPATDDTSLPTALGEVLAAKSYADGMGRPLQSIARKHSPDQKDIISFYEYDELGRMAKQYLPYVSGTSGSYKQTAKTAQASFYQASGDNIANDTRPFTETTFETSPMSRVKTSLGVGEAWHTADKKASVSYETNTTAEGIYIWQVVNDVLTKTGAYSTGELYKTTGVDEEDHTVVSYSNKVGQSILKKVESGTNTWTETYSVYDNKGRLRYVLPPAAVNEYNTNGNVMDQTLLDTWAFQYKYDHRNRLIEKRVPGAGWVYMVYDDRNRLVLSQDGNQRTSDKWSFVKYDQLNRAIMTGEKVIIGTATSIRTTVANATVFYESYDAAGLMKYSDLAYPTGVVADEIYSVSYYDNYDFTSKTFSMPTDPSDVFSDLSDHKETPTVTSHSLQGLATGSMTKVLGTTTFLETVNFYDDKYRLVQSISENHKGGRDITTVQYNFAGQVMKTLVDHNPDGTANNSTTIVQEYTYDHAGRALSTTHSINESTPVTIASYTYNELGALENKTLADGFEDIDYAYNIRGWITQMNNPNDSEDHLFEIEFKYETATNQIYNGNIGEVVWKSPYETTLSSFDYTYDEMNRLKTADYNNTGTSTRDYGLESINYDVNSNITSLKRKGDHDDTANQSFDDLVYNYTGNQLMAVTDNAAMDTGFKDGNTSGDDFVYDDNGNLIEDKNKGITAITYNHINQPTKVTYDANKYMEYTYAASGAKVAQTVVENGVTSVTDYLGGFLYKDDVLQIISHSQGRIVAEYDEAQVFQGYEYQYHLTDHLGNVRVTFKTEIDTDVLVATMETENDTAESPYFYNLDTRATHAGANHTASGDEAAKLDQNHLIGPAIALRVVPGDEVDMEVYAYYEGGSGYNNTVTVNSFVAALASSFGGASGAGGEAGSIFSGIDEAVTAGAGGVGGSGNDNVPAAYLSYILFDQNYEEVQSGYHEISSSASFAQERLFLDDIAVTEPGYLYIYTSMQSDVTSPVYFDDLQVSHTHSPVVQKDDYLPFGLSFNSYSRAAITDQNFKFNAGSELEAMTDWYSTPFRKYDPSLGRFHGVDKLASLYPGITPSHFGANNPINFNDPTGLEVVPNSAPDGDDDPGQSGDSGITSFIPMSGPWYGQDMRSNDRIASAERGHGGANIGASAIAGSGAHWSDYYRSAGDPMWTTTGLAIAFGDVTFYNAACKCNVNAIEFLRFGEINGYQNTAYRALAELALEQAKKQREDERGYEVVLGGSGPMGDALFGIPSNSNNRAHLVDMDGMNAIFSRPNWWNNFWNKSNSNQRGKPDNTHWWDALTNGLSSLVSASDELSNTGTNDKLNPVDTEQQIIENAVDSTFLGLKPFNGGYGFKFEVTDYTIINGDTTHKFTHYRYHPNK